MSLLVGGLVSAQERGLPDPGLTPDSPFYFFDTLGEKVEMLFTFGPKNKAEKAIQYAEEKLAEVKAIRKESKKKALEKAKQKYKKWRSLAEQKIEEAKQKGKNVEALQRKIEEIVMRDLLYPGAAKVNFPFKIKQDLKEVLSTEVEVRSYSSKDSIKKVKEWYQSSLPERGWKIIGEEENVRPGATLYYLLLEKEETDLLVKLAGGKYLAEGLGIGEKDTAITLIEGKAEGFETLKRIMAKDKREKKDPRVVSAIGQARTVMSYVYAQDGNYDNFTKSSPNEMSGISAEIKDNYPDGGVFAVEHGGSPATTTAIYSQLNASYNGKTQYYCADSTGNAGYTVTDPSSDGKTGVCPSDMRTK